MNTNKINIASIEEIRLTAGKIDKDKFDIIKLKESGWLSEEELASNGFKYLNDYLGFEVYKKEPDEKNTHYFFSKLSIGENGSFTNMYKLVTTASSYYTPAQKKPD